MSYQNKPMQSKDSTRLSKIAVLLSIAAGLVVFVFLIILCVTDNVEVQQSRKDAGYTRVLEYSCRDVENTDAPIGIVKEYTFSIDENLEEDTHLAFYTVHQYVEVYLDDALIYSLKPSENQHISKTVGSNWVMLPLYREDVGKEIRVEITPVYESFRNREVEFLIGSQLKIFTERLWKDLPQLILSVMAVFVGLMFICVAGYNLLKKHRGKSIAALGLFSVMMGFWRLTDTRFTPFIFANRPVFVFCISVTMLMVGMLPLVYAMRDRFHRISCRILDAYCIGAALLCLLQILLQFCGILDLREGLLVTHMVIAVGIVVIAGNVLFERIRYPEQYKMQVGKKLSLILVVGVLADVAAFYIKGNSSGLLFSLLAFLLYIVFLGIATTYNYSDQEIQLAEKDRQLAENERKLTESRVSTMMSQIRTHFIFNVMNAISGYCKYDAQKADDALIHFSRYLRRNIKIMEEDAPIMFQQELEYLEDYIILEQVRFGDKIQYLTDIEEKEFKLPPMVLQPIAENAIKHGLLGKKEGGTIRLCTKKEAGHIVIIIQDDGVGFDTNAEPKENSVGLKNVRFRLEHMVNGRMEIESSPGEGTTVTIRIPYSQRSSKEAGK